MRHLALTGNVASGKSTVAELFRGWGATIIDADRLVREVQRPGSPVLDAIVHRFGPNVLLPSGELDRPGLRAIVMRDALARSDLNALVHPAVQQRRLELVEAARRAGAEIVISDIPLLFETLDPNAFDATILVDAPDAVRLDRLIRQRGLTEEQARALMAAQMPARNKRDWVLQQPSGRAFLVPNDADLATLERWSREIWQQLLTRSAE